MAFEQYPPSGYEEHPYGLHVALVGDPETDIPTRNEVTIAAFRAALGATIDPVSSTSLASRLVQETYYADEDEDCEFPLYRVAINSLQDDDDIDNDVIDLWIAIQLDGRGIDWPSVAADKLAIDAIFAAMAP